MSLKEKAGAGCEARHSLGDKADIISAKLNAVRLTPEMLLKVGPLLGQIYQSATDIKDIEINHNNTISISILLYSCKHNIGQKHSIV